MSYERGTPVHENEIQNKDNVETAVAILETAPRHLKPLPGHVLGSGSRAMPRSIRTP